MNRSCILRAAAAALIVLTAVPAVAGEITRDFNESFEVERGWTLRLRHGDGEVTITPWDKDVIEVTVRYRAERKGWGDDDEIDFTVEFEEKNGVLEVTGKEPKSGFMGFHVYILKEYTYDISAPPYVELDLHGDDGDVDIEKWKAPVEIKIDDGNVSMYDCEPGKTRIRAADGEITLDGLSGSLDLIGDDCDVELNRAKLTDCRIQGEDGEIEVRDCEGDFFIEVDDADVELMRIRTSVMDIKGQDGDIDIELLKTKELDIELRTDDGDIDLGLASGISAEFAIDVDDGSIRTDLPSAKEVQSGDGWMSGKLGKGKNRIRIRTNDGSVMLRELR